MFTIAAQLKKILLTITVKPTLGLSNVRTALAAVLATPFGELPTNLRRQIYKYNLSNERIK